MGVGIVLSHGYCGNPESVRPWAESLRTAGHTVVTPTLPGHGTRWQDMIDTGWDDWYACIESAFDELRREHDHVFLGGLSMGGALVLSLSAARPDDVAGVLLVNPVAELRVRGAWLAPVLARIIRSAPTQADDIKRQGVTERGYDRASTKAGLSVIKGIRPIADRLDRITAPVVLFRSVEDHLVPDRSHELVMGQVSSSDTTLHLLRDSYHVATLDNDAPFIGDESVAFVQRVVEQSRSQQ
jgi:carboxylesterase